MAAIESFDVKRTAIEGREKQLDAIQLSSIQQKTAKNPYVVTPNACALARPLDRTAGRSTAERLAAFGTAAWHIIGIHVDVGDLNDVEQIAGRRVEDAVTGGQIVVLGAAGDGAVVERVVRERAARH